MFSESFLKCWRSPCQSTHEHGRYSCPPGTRLSAFQLRGTNNGRYACSRSSPSKPTFSTTTTSSTDHTSSNDVQLNCRKKPQRNSTMSLNSEEHSQRLTP